MATKEIILIVFLVIMLALKIGIIRLIIVNKDPILTKISKMWLSILVFIQPIIGYFVYKGYVETNNK